MTTKKLLISKDRTPDQGKVNIMFTRKYSVAPYETFDVTVGGEVSIKPGQTSNDALKELFRSLKTEFDDITEVMKKDQGIVDDVD